MQNVQSYQTRWYVASISVRWYFYLNYAQHLRVAWMNKLLTWTNLMKVVAVQCWNSMFNLCKVCSLHYWCKLCSLHYECNT